ncbi:MAG: DegV family protein [Ruminococcaceae bacterium]|nr:DegV family protein [Oscillospiraceae bacterium]
MKKVVITVDSAADIPSEIADEYGIKVVPMCVVFNGKPMQDSVNITASEIFDYVKKTGEIPKTTAVPPGEYFDFFSQFVKDGFDVVHLSFCSELSSTFRNAKIASSRMSGVYTLDTRSLGGGIALLALKGCEMRNGGMSAEEIYSALSSLVPQTRVSYVLDSVDFLRRSGRCSSAAALGAGLFSVKPCAAMVDGKIEVIKKYRGKSKAVRLQYASEQLQFYKNIDFSAAFIYHSGVPKNELQTVEEMLKCTGFRRVITAFTGCMISLHSGRNALGIHFIAE